MYPDFDRASEQNQSLFTIFSIELAPFIVYFRKYLLGKSESIRPAPARALYARHAKSTSVQALRGVNYNYVNVISKCVFSYLPPALDKLHMDENFESK